MITQDDIHAAERLIRPHVRRTPVLHVAGRSLGLTGRLHLKLECMQRCGSFKPRGAFHTLLSTDHVPASGVITASGGNHGLAVAAAAQALGIPAEVYLPTSASPVKVARLQGYGAHIVQIGQHYPEAFEASRQRAQETGALFVHAYDQRAVVVGQGTVGLELTEQVPDVDTVLVAVGGGGLVAGIASWFGGSVKVVGVEPVSIPTLANALKAGRPVDVEVSGIAADALGARRVGDIALAAAMRTGVESILVTDEDIVSARQMLWSEFRIAVEYGAAAAFAVLSSGAYVPHEAERVAVVLCGGNTHPVDLAS